MLQNLREHVQGWIAGVIASILGLAFALWGVEYYLNSGTTEVMVANVNGDKISKDQLELAYSRARQTQSMQLADPAMNEAFQKQLKLHTLNGLIQQSVLAHAAAKVGYLISPAQVGATLQQIPAFQVNGQFSLGLFEQALTNLSYTPALFAQDLAKSNLLKQVQHSLVDSNFALPTDVNQFMVLQGQKRDFSYFLISPSDFLPHVSVNEQAIQRYYSTHSNEFTVPEQWRLQYVLLSTDEANKKIVISEAELKRYYEENKLNFPQSLNYTAAKSQVEKSLRQQKIEEWVAEQSDKLANLTYTHPETLKLAADALNLPIQTTAWFSRRGGTGLLANSNVLAAAFSDIVLQQHSNSDVITVDDQSLAVVRLAGHKPASVQPLAQVRSFITQTLKQQAAQQAAQALGEKLVQQMHQGVAPSAVASRYKLVWQQYANVSRLAQDVPVDILDWVFNQPALVSKKPIIQGKQLADGKYLVLALNRVTAGSLTASDHLLLQKQLGNDFGSLDYALYLTRQMLKANIKIVSTPAAF